MFRDFTRVPREKFRREERRVSFLRRNGMLDFSVFEGDTGGVVGDST